MVVYLQGKIERKRMLFCWRTKIRVEVYYFWKITSYFKVEINLAIVLLVVFSYSSVLDLIILVF